MNLVILQGEKLACLAVDLAHQPGDLHLWGVGRLSLDILE
jgi:hypothetical protein